ncbi:MAG: hypothetical protein JXA62_09150 [Candidatus Aminicenantes bacterium]|nr:hypothetical protein [Candidatus Aminicenantes bacterium]
MRLSALGDVIHTLPAVVQLAGAFPGARLDWICSPPVDRLLSIFNLTDHVHSLDIRHQPLSGALAALRSFRRRHHGKYSMVVDFQGLIKSAVVARMAGRNVLGFHSRNLREPMASMAYRFQAAPWPEDSHVIFKNIHLLSALGIKADGVRYPGLRSNMPSLRLQHFLTHSGLNSGKFCVLNTGAGWLTKTPPLDLLVQVGNFVRSRLGAVLLWGNPAELERARTVSDQTGIPMAPETDFSDLVQLIRSATCIVSADTLALHVADMVNTPSIGLFAPTSPQRNGSLLPLSRAVVSSAECRFCYRRTCRKMNCLSQLSPVAVCNAVTEVLDASV